MPRTKGTRIGNGAGGMGWGGPAKGAGSGPKRPYGPENPGMTPAEARAARGDAPSKYATRKAELEARADEYLDLMDTIARDAANPAKLRLVAMEKARHEIVGTPTSKQQLEIKRPIEEMSEAELASAIELLRAAVAGTAEGAGSGSNETGHGKPH